MNDRFRKPLHLPIWLRPAPDSLAAQMHARGSRSWLSLFNLLWSFWVFCTPFFTTVGPAFYWSVGISYPIFLLLIAWLHVRPMREGGIYILALAALACTNMPFNYSAWDYGVFACAYIPWFYAGSLKRGELLQCGLRFALVMMMLVVVAVASHWPLSAMIVMIGICTAVATGSLAGSISVSKNMAERMSMEEVRRLAAGAERERIGRDLHDLLGHTLSLITLKLELSRKLFDQNPAQAREELADAERVARHALAEVRSAVTGIRATGLAGEMASARLMLRSSGVELTAGELPVLPHDIDDVLALVLRESITNIHRHAQARHAQVDVRREQGRVLMRIRDDGLGGIRRHGNGLTGMRQRVEALSGALEIASGPGQGTELDVMIPLPAADAVGEPAVRPKHLPHLDDRIGSRA